MALSPPRTSRSWLDRAGYAASAWALIFSAQSFYHAAGGTAGAETIGPAIAEHVLAREPLWVAAMWITGGLKVAAALLGLALVRPWGRHLPRWLLLVAGWGAVAVMAVYEGAASLAQHALMVAGVIDIPAGLGPTAARWHLALWDPWWLLGGILFGVATWRYQRRSRVHAVPDRPGRTPRGRARP
ncbi:DUF3995 domain-containing protein [Sphaerobacter sp.]|uniref:DUF3995 domain-containing protein n=1 Tax=Sphaerobacter sp. TaxID=2099654 RepID=UPI0025E1ED7C|nr:DUF3995 domain-containing protein [Sphaerobacter sp.]